MNFFRKIFSPWLSLPVFALLIILVFVFRPDAARFKTDAKESLELLQDKSLMVKLQDLPGKLLIDIRTPELFSQGHPADAVNIPVRQLLNKESLESFENLLQKGKEAVLYGTDELQATAPFLLLQQMGYNNLRLLAGGYTWQNGFKEPEPASTEIPLLTSGALQFKKENTPVIKAKKPRNETVIPVRKKATSGGGC